MARTRAGCLSLKPSLRGPGPVIASEARQSRMDAQDGQDLMAGLDVRALGTAPGVEPDAVSVPIPSILCIDVK